MHFETAKIVHCYNHNLKVGDSVSVDFEMNYLSYKPENVFHERCSCPDDQNTPNFNQH